MTAWTGIGSHRRTQDGFDAFVDQVSGDLVRLAYQLTFDRSETEDLVQEALLRVARSWPRVRAMEHPAAYVRRIVVNLAIDASEQRVRHRAEVPLDESRDAVEASATGGDLHWIDTVAEVRWALEKLPPRQRAALVARYWLDLTEAEAADLLQCSVGTIKSTTSRALARLRLVVGTEAAGTAHREAGVTAASEPPDVASTRTTVGETQ